MTRCRPLPLLLLGLALPLTACQDREARAEVARLEARVTDLEARVEALRAAAPLLAEATATVQRAAAAHCEADLSRTLELARQERGSYPAEAALTVPGSCQGFRVTWECLTSQRYAFRVLDGSGQTLASGAEE
ncbi:hypothetical protein RDMS_12645 [Deinococcus sp. RL]|uniref:hypothetical protein n=1 Tax=Deinococcus sp. RL TaxID=1489678 RepID=UPI0004D89FC4|nr:hypothetical protein [Deinococcus sp. RL]KEF33359.1 hypothetical protein RDMS_12645 [Deinococcus sp. RL]